MAKLMIRELQSRQHPSGEPIFEGPTCFVRRQERMIMSRIFSSAEPAPQLTWTAMIWDIVRATSPGVQTEIRESL